MQPTTQLPKLFLLLFLGLALPACEEGLDSQPPGEFSPGNVLQSEAGLQALLYSSYQSANYANAEMKNIINMQEVTTDMAYNSGGGENRTLSLFINFTFDPSVDWLRGSLWNPPYGTVRDANILLENVEGAGLADATAAGMIAEARFLRSRVYSELYVNFGPVPLRTSTDQEDELPRASDAEMLDFIETELEAAIPDLPAPGDEAQYGRANTGQALAVLTKMHLNSRQWEKAVEASGRLMDLNYYALYPRFEEAFRVANEGNREMIIVHQAIALPGGGSWFNNGTFPPGFSFSSTVPEFRWKSAMANWATQYRLLDDFVDSFDPADQRLNLIIQQYTNLDGEEISLRDVPDNSRSLKYYDNDQIGNDAGTDYPVIRYADILLSRAEALNELGGPGEEAMELVNQVRRRAGLTDLALTDVSTQEAFREHILLERGWEFVSEAKRREDLIRHGVFISRARERGVNAQDYQVLFPIPEDEIVANGAVKQNTGY